MKIVNRVVSEEFSGRISNIKNRLFENKGSKMCESCGSGDMYEGECMECGNMYEGSEMCESCGSEMKEGKMCESCGNTYEGNIQELGGMDDGHPRFGKKRLPNKMSIEDIENLLRGDNDSDDYKDLSMYNPYYDDYEEEHYDDEDENEPTYRGSKRYDDSFDGYEDIGEDVCEECGDTYERELDEKLYGNQSRIDRNKNNRIDSEDFKMLRKGDSEERELDEKLYGNQSRIDRNKNGRIDKEDFKMLRKESKVYFTESEIIDIIENIVKEEKKKGKAPSAQNILKSTLGQSKKENEENIKRVAKKMKEYLKDGSKGKYDPNPKYFPKGNGEIEKMEKMAFSLTDDNEDFNYEIAGLNIPVPDAIEFNDERMDKYYEGSSETGNAPGGNAIESEANSRFNKMRKKQTLHRLKQQSYNKSPQPVFNEKSGQEKGKGINIKLESTEDKKVISEMEKIKNLIGYNRKTQ